MQRIKVDLAPMTTNNQQWVDRDLQVLWHPCSQMKDYAEAAQVSKELVAEGIKAIELCGGFGNVGTHTARFLRDAECRIVAVSDIMCESFRPGVMERLGLAGLGARVWFHGRFPFARGRHQVPGPAAAAVRDHDGALREGALLPHLWHGGGAD